MSKGVCSWHTGESRGRTYLRSDQGKARRHRRLKDTEEQSDRNGTRKALHPSKATQDQTPGNNTRGGVLAQRQTLQQAVGRVLPCQITYALAVSYSLIPTNRYFFLFIGDKTHQNRISFPATDIQHP